MEERHGETQGEETSPLVGHSRVTQGGGGGGGGVPGRGKMIGSERDNCINVDIKYK